jgi:hypothetical protein
MPPIMHRADGGMRRVGIEIEFSGLALEEAADVLLSLLGGPSRRLGRYEIEIDGDPAGAWQVELDFELLKALGRREIAADLGGAVQELAEDTLRAIAERIVPVEAVSPPLPMDRLSDVDRLIDRLRTAGARGTDDDPTYAFGMQLNPEIPDTDADTLRQYLQAYLCLEDWLRERARVDLTRRLTFFADPFPKDYARRVVDEAYSPSRGRLIDDYLSANPTRNRGLDLLPLFAHVDEQRVRSVVDDERIKPRPTLHYRLPNSEIDRPDWGLRDAWQDWLVLERLAAEPERLTACCRAYAEFLDRPLSGLTGDWAAQTNRWLAEQGLTD